MNRFAPGNRLTLLRNGAEYFAALEKVLLQKAVTPSPDVRFRKVKLLGHDARAVTWTGNNPYVGDQTVRCYWFAEDNSIVVMRFAGPPGRERGPDVEMFFASFQRSGDR